MHNFLKTRCEILETLYFSKEEKSNKHGSKHTPKENPLFTSNTQALVLRARLTRLQNFVEKLDLSQVTDEVVINLQERLEKFEPSWDEFNELQLQIKGLNANDSDDPVIFEDSYFEIVSKIKNICVTHHQLSQQKEVRGSCASGNGSCSSGNNSCSNKSCNNNINVRLPPVSLPQFSGEDYSDWVEYRDAFVNLVHKNQQLGDYQRYYYLRSSLSKHAASIIKNIPTSGDHYKVAWDLLVERFENKKLLIHNHIHSIFELQALTRESHVDLRNLFNDISKHLRSLKALGEETHSWDRLIIYILTKKFDSTTRRDWESFDHKGGLPTINDMHNFLKTRCEILETLYFSKEEKSSKHGSKHTPKRE
uniref:Uncharacterized protein LOC114344782 n=1 Tax=Diabrotica virgifera virgifera TaxID=50390 RepID=A0A6P7GP82_DIAVI